MRFSSYFFYLGRNSVFCFVGERRKIKLKMKMDLLTKHDNHNHNLQGPWSRSKARPIYPPYLTPLLFHLKPHFFPSLLKSYTHRIYSLSISIGYWNWNLPSCPLSLIIYFFLFCSFCERERERERENRKTNQAVKPPLPFFSVVGRTQMPK
jgi:hypothetical protein